MLIIFNVVDIIVLPNLRVDIELTSSSDKLVCVVCGLSALVLVPPLSLSTALYTHSYTFSCLSGCLISVVYHAFSNGSAQGTLHLNTGLGSTPNNFD